MYLNILTPALTKTCVISLALLPFLAQGQSSIDSLNQVLQTDITEKQKVDIYVRLAKETISTDSASGVNYVNQALAIAEKTDYTKGKINALIALSTILNFQKAGEEIFQQIKRLSEKINDPDGIAEAFRGLGTVYRHEPSKALVNYLKALEISEKTGNQERVLSLLSLIARVYENTGNYTKAIEYSNQKLKIQELLGDKSGIARTLFLMGGIHIGLGNLKDTQEHYEKVIALYRDLNETSNLIRSLNTLGSFLQKNGDYSKAKELFISALDIAIEVKNKTAQRAAHILLGSIYSDLFEFDMALKYYQQAQDGLEDKFSKVLVSKGIGLVYLKQGQDQKAWKLLDEALDYYKQVGLSHQIKFLLLEIGNIYSDKKQFSEAKKYLSQSLVIAEEIQNLQVINSIYKSLTLIEEQQGNYRKAFQYHVLFKQTSDSLKKEEGVKALTRIYDEMEFQQERDSIQAANREQELLLDQEIQQKETIQYATISGITVLLIMLFILYRYYKAKANANQLLQIQNDQMTIQKRELETLDIAKSRFFANVSHELRTPLTLISAPTKEILSKGLGTPRAYENLKLIKNNTDSLQLLVNDILELSKLGFKKAALKVHEVNIHQFLNRLWNNFESLSGSLEIDYQIDLSSLASATLKIDSLKVEKIINNLLSNALKHSSPRDKVTFTATEAGEYFRIQIADTGAGISTTDLPYIFDRFFQSKQPDAPLQGGTGIGLALAKEYTLLIGGSLSVESSLGKGSTFTLDLPYELAESPIALESQTYSVLDEEDFYEVPVIETVEKTITSEKKRSILVVEDHPEMQQFIRGLLEEEYEVTSAFNGRQGLEQLSEKAFDLIISDVMMPEMDGFTLLKELRENETFQSLPVIMLTALSNEENMLKALSIGVDDYLAKPFSPAELLARVSNMLIRHQVRLQMQPLEKVASQEATENIKTKNDVQLITEVERIILAEMENETFKLEDMADHFHLSTRQLHRRIKQIAGLSPKEYQREVALQKARRLLEEDTYNNLSAVAYSVGIRNTTRFAQYFKNRFGKDPKEYFKVSF